MVSGQVWVLNSQQSCDHLGAIGGGLRNAFGMIAMIYAQQWATRLGMRDDCS